MMDIEGVQKILRERTKSESKAWHEGYNYGLKMAAIRRGEPVRIIIEGRGITEFPGHTTGIVRTYEKTATVLAAVAMQAGEVETPEGNMKFSEGDYIVTDNPPTHCWPVKREVFDATYKVTGK